MFKTSTPLRDLCIYYLSKFIETGETVKGTIIDRIVKFDLCPIECAFSKTIPCRFDGQQDGVVDSLKQLIYHDNCIKPWSNEHILTVLLTKAF
jgi:hypothetical protein